MGSIKKDEEGIVHLGDAQRERAGVGKGGAGLRAAAGNSSWQLRALPGSEHCFITEVEFKKRSLTPVRKPVSSSVK